MVPPYFPRILNLNDPQHLGVTGSPSNDQNTPRSGPEVHHHDYADHCGHYTGHGHGQGQVGPPFAEFVVFEPAETLGGSHGQ